ncbi:hypothetical protein GCM10011386_32320 [Parapedobacter defluvii]|uniref:Uncharacterized protein n=1 Tax=Parapedobacter defluvii TaxID=2045106 RepID=A0ABQ1ME31_9SPHI|nr:hypothetical protein [Parapedobacter defluvii]GGC37739.1 hypothetical protein GCM10011386_32320 [Parapedobacter defluvii]
MKTIFLSAFFLTTLMSLTSCKKDADDTQPAGANEVTTLEVEYRTTTAVYGMEYTFRLKFEKISSVKEYGIIFIPWISEKSGTTPTVGGKDAILIPFTDKPGKAGTVLSSQVTFPFSYFNDANYRAYAVLTDGTVIYGEILHIVFS